MSLALRLHCMELGPLGDRVRLGAALAAEAPRSGKWPTVEKHHLEKEGWCRFCGTTEHLQVHHVMPFHLDPAKELDDTNLITLCMKPERECHLRMGHLGSWFKFNPKIREQAICPGPNKNEKALMVAEPLWGFTRIVDGDDLVYVNLRGTCFGGPNDPEDDGQTASGWSTKAHPDSPGISLPLNGQQFTGLNTAEHNALDGSPFPRMPWLTEIQVALLSPTIPTSADWSALKAGLLLDWKSHPLIDLGPARRTGNGFDLVTASAQEYDTKASPVNFSMRGIVRIPGGVRYLSH